VSHIKRRLTKGDPKVNCFHVDDEGTLWFSDRIVVPHNQALQKKIFDEVHTSKYYIHPGSTKMYHDLKAQFWWTRMKCETACFVAECDACRRVKTDHLRTASLLQPLNTPAWKWEDISMNFIVGLPLTARKCDSIMVIFDRFTKLAHFIPVTRPRDMQSCTLSAFYVCMGCPTPSSLTEELSSLPISGRSCMLL
jgi:hypothetical protein